MAKDNFKKKTSLVFVQIITFGLAVFLLVFYAIANIYGKTIIVAKSILEGAESQCNCMGFFSPMDHPFLTTGLSIAALAALFYILYSIISISKVYCATRKYVNYNLIKRKKNLSRKLSQVAASIKLQGKVVEIECEAPTICCFGLINPKICISSGLIKKLNSKELESVMLHEKEHFMNRDPLKIFLIKIIIKILFFIPILKLLSDKYFVYSELAADEKATASFKEKESLVGAMCKIIKMKESFSLNSKIAVSLFSVTNERINKLLNEEYRPEIKLSGAVALISALSILFFIGIDDSLAYFDKAEETGSNQNKCQLTTVTNFESINYFSNTIMDSSGGMSCSKSYVMNINECGDDGN